jgi:predicted dehydrogenase
VRPRAPLFVAYYRRAMPRFKTVQELLDGGAIGAPRTVTVRLQRRFADLTPADLPWWLRPEISGAGLFVDMGSHTLDLLDWLLGPVTHVSGVAANQGGTTRAEDLVAGVFEFTSGVRGVGLWLFDADEDRDEVEITGTGGSLRFSTIGQEPLRLTGVRDDSLIEAPYPRSVQQPLIQTVGDELTGRGVCPNAGASAARTARVVDTLLWEYGGRTGTSLVGSNQSVGSAAA